MSGQGVATNSPWQRTSRLAEHEERPECFC